MTPDAARARKEDQIVVGRHHAHTFVVILGQRTFLIR
jgi:hypothetical protein